MLTFTTHIAQGLLQENDVTLLDHPACSFDLNPIENLWEWLAKEAYKIGHHFQTMDALYDGTFTKWSSVPANVLETLD